MAVKCYPLPSATVRTWNCFRLWIAAAWFRIHCVSMGTKSRSFVTRGTLRKPIAMLIWICIEIIAQVISIKDDTREGFEVLTAAVMKSCIFGNVTPCSQFKAKRYFGGIYRLHLPDTRENQAGNNQSFNLCLFRACFLLGWLLKTRVEGDMFIRNVGWLSTDYRVFPRKYNSWYLRIVLAEIRRRNLPNTSHKNCWLSQFSRSCSYYVVVIYR
jgi:hypothetical protein